MKCPLGLCKVSVIPPTALNSIDSDGGSHMHFSMLPSLSALEMGVLAVLRHDQQEASSDVARAEVIVGSWELL